MNVTLTTTQTTTIHTFDVTHDGKTYLVNIYVDDKGKFADDTITLDGEELENEGAEGEIREAITDYLDKNWDTLVKA